MARSQLKGMHYTYYNSNEKHMKERERSVLSIILDKLGGNSEVSALCDYFRRGKFYELAPVCIKKENDTYMVITSDNESIPLGYIQKIY